MSFGPPPTPSSGAIPKASRGQIAPPSRVTSRTVRTRRVDVEERNRRIRERMGSMTDDDGYAMDTEALPAAVLQALAEATPTSRGTSMPSGPQPRSGTRMPSMGGGITHASKQTVRTMKDASGRVLQTETVTESTDNLPQGVSSRRTETVQQGASGMSRGAQPMKRLAPPQQVAGGRAPPRQVAMGRASDQSSDSLQSRRAHTAPLRRPAAAQMEQSSTSVQQLKTPRGTVKIIKTSGTKPGMMAKSVVSSSSVQSGLGRPAKGVKMVAASVESLGAGVHKKRAIVESTTSIGSSRASSASSTSRYGGARAPRPGAPGPAKTVRVKKGAQLKKPSAQQLDFDIEKQLREMSMKAPQQSLQGSGAKSGIMPPPMMKTPHGEVEVVKKLIAKKAVIRAPGQPEIVAESMTGIQTVAPGRAEVSEIEIQKLNPKAKSPASVTAREVAEVTSSVAFADGYVETTRTVSYDAPEHPKKKQLSPMLVAQLVAEENADIEKSKDLVMPELQASRPVTYALKKNVELGLLHPESVNILEKSIIPTFPSADAEQEEPEPEMLASMMNTEERGLNMVSRPAEVYDFLFNDEDQDCLLDVSSAAAFPLQDIVVPMNMPSQEVDTANHPDVLEAGQNLVMNADNIVEDMYVETVGKELPANNNTAEKGATLVFQGGPMLSKVMPPWGIKNYMPVADLLGAQPASNYLQIPDENAPEIIADPATDGIEYMIQVEPPRHSSKVQLRGSQQPSWFPGYYLALPKIPEVLTVVRSPSFVFASAWKATQPDIFAEDSVVVS